MVPIFTHFSSQFSHYDSYLVNVKLNCKAYYIWGGEEVMGININLQNIHTGKKWFATFESAMIGTDTN